MAKRQRDFAADLLRDVDDQEQFLRLLGKA
jgi:hypothetical protein